MPMDHPQYYTTLPALHRQYRATAKKLAFEAQTEMEYADWKNRLRRTLRDITGLGRIQICGLQPRQLAEERLDGYSRIKMVIQTESGVEMPFYMLVPGGMLPGEKRPAVIAPHGHLGGGKESVAGNGTVPCVARAIEAYHYDYGVRLVQQGYVVFCPDARGSGERREYWLQGDAEEKVLGSCCNHLNFIAISMGLSLNAWLTWDLMRLIDYIETDPRCDAARLACCGFSGGGLQTLWLAAQDDRVKCAVISGYFYGSEDALLELPNCGCNFVPRLWEYADFGELGALIAPRPLLIESAESDHLNGRRGLQNVSEQLETVRKAYRLFHSERKVWHSVIPGDHHWGGKEAVRFLSENL